MPALPRAPSLSLEDSPLTGCRLHSLSVVMDSPLGSMQPPAPHLHCPSSPLVVMRMESSRFAVVQAKNPPPSIFASMLSLTLYVQAVSEPGCSKSAWTPVLASFSSASPGRVMSCLTSMITTPPTWLPSSPWSSLDQGERALISAVRMNLQHSQTMTSSGWLPKRLSRHSE